MCLQSKSKHVHQLLRNFPNAQLLLLADACGFPHHSFVRQVDWLAHIDYDQRAIGSYEPCICRERVRQHRCALQQPCGFQDSVHPPRVQLRRRRQLVSLWQDEDTQERNCTFGYGAVPLNAICEHYFKRCRVHIGLDTVPLD
jgi:hypothetical protein